VTRASWILEVRERLASPPPQALATEGARLAKLVPLFVDAGELWLLLLGPTGEELLPGASTLPEAPVDRGEDPWLAAERCAARMALEPATLLRLGTLDQVPSPAGDVVTPCVAATPPPERSGTARSAAPPLVRLPLRAARTPSLLEERLTVVRGVETWVVVAHVGPVKLAGAEVEIVGRLLERLFQ
jgi:hypothetical protein